LEPDVVIVNLNMQLLMHNLDVRLIIVLSVILLAPDNGLHMP